MTAIVQTRPRVDYMRKAQALLELWPQGVRYDVGVTWVAPLKPNGWPRLGSIMGLVGLQDWAIANGFETIELACQEAGIKIAARLRQPIYLPKAAWGTRFTVYSVRYSAGATALYGRAAVAAFFGIGEWDAGRTFDLYADDRASQQQGNVSHRLGELIKQNGG